MPYVNIKITSEPKATREQKAEVIKQVTQTLATVLGKDPATTFIVIEEVALENWGVDGVPTDVWLERKRK